MSVAAPLVSVVVPVYNTEKYLDQCITSLINQTLKDIELIFVDDGSTDSSVSILERYQASDDRIKILKQKNQYAGVARNNGMDHASGKYIIFLDSDDFFELNMLEEMYNAAEESEADITICDYYVFDDSINQVSNKKKRDFCGIIYPKDIENDVFGAFSPEPWTRLYLVEFLNRINIHFQPLKNTNDMYFTLISQVLANKIMAIDEYLVYYRVNNMNSLQGSLSKNELCFGKALKAIKNELIERNVFNNKIKRSFYQECAAETRHVISKMESYEEGEILYKYCKSLFDDIDFINNYKAVTEDEITSLIDSNEYNEYLYYERNRYRIENRKLMQKVHQLEKKQSNSISKKSMTYKVGNAILYIPRKIRDYFRK